MNDRSRGPWTQTLTGHCWYPFDPQPEDVYFADLQALARINRFGGHTLCDGYSVAEHSVRVAVRVQELGGDRLTCVAALLHDAHEAYPPGDQLGPFLRECRGRLSGLVRIVEAAEWVVREAFNVNSDFAHPASAELIRRADVELLATERRDLMAPSDVDWGQLPEPLPGRIEPWSPGIAWESFAALFRELGGRALR